MSTTEDALKPIVKAANDACAEHLTLEKMDRIREDFCNRFPGESPSGTVAYEIVPFLEIEGKIRVHAMISFWFEAKR